jgi:hypothetical protein
MEENTYIGITLIRGFYVNDTYKHITYNINIENGAHGTKNLLLKTQVNGRFSEVNLIIQYIIVQDQDGQNINIVKGLFLIYLQTKI